MNQLKAQEIIQLYNLKPHPEGGYFLETYRSSETSLFTDPFNGIRNISTAIYFLLVKNSKSNLHRIHSDEAWHFYLGGPMTLVQISPSGKKEIITLGQDIKNGQKLQHIVPAGHWFGGFPNEGVEYSFVGCTVAPGFDFNDFELAKRSELTQAFPHEEQIIKRLTD